MSQSGFTPVLIYASGTTGNSPSAANLTSSSQGAELALNYFDGKLFYKDASGNVQVLATKGTGPIGGSNTQIQYNSSGALAGSANLTFDGTNLAIGGSPVSSKGQLQVGTIGYTDTGVLAGFASSVAGYNQIILQNTNSGATASTNFNVSNDQGSATTNYGEFGINSSGFSGSGFSTAGWTYLASASTDLAIGTYGSNAIHFIVNSGTTDAMTILSSGNVGIGTSNPTAALDVVKPSFAGGPLISARFNTSNFRMGFGIGNTNGFPFLGVNVNNASNDNGTFDIAGYASRIRMDNGLTQFQVSSASGSAGGAITWNTQAILDTSGNLGLGVTPSAWRTSYGQKAIQFGPVGFVYSLSASSTNNQTFLGSNYYLNSSGNPIYINSDYATAYAQTNGQHIWQVAPSGTSGGTATFTQAMTLDASGNLGVGTTSPAVSGINTTINVKSPNSSASAYLLAQSSDGGSSIGLLSGNSSSDQAAIIYQTALRFGTASGVGISGFTERMRIDSSGNLGLGVTPSAWSGSYKVNQVLNAGFIGNGNRAYVSANWYDNGTADKYIASDYATRYIQLNGTHRWDNAASGTAGNTITFTQAMTLDASGNLLVGATSASSAAKVFVSSNCNSLNGFNIQDTGTTGGAFAAFYNSANANAGYIAHNGTTTVQYITSSDYRLKENVAPMTGALAKIALLKPCTYTWKDGGAEGQGFIAHELQEIVPDAVYGEKDAVNEDGSIKAQGIDTSFLVATLTAAIQELNAKFEEYKAAHP